MRAVGVWLVAGACLVAGCSSGTETPAPDDAATSSEQPDPPSEPADPPPTREERQAVKVCDLLDEAVAADGGPYHNAGPFTSFLEDNAGGLNPAKVNTALKVECPRSISAYEDAYREGSAQSHADSLAAREDETDGEWWEAFEQPLGGCFRDYDAAGYLSAQALTAATCIADEMAFGGADPSADAVRNLTADILFHATWATWDTASRQAHCSPVRINGYDGAEQLGVATVQTWNDQLAGAGVDKQFDDYAMVLDFLDACEAT